MSTTKKMIEDIIVILNEIGGTAKIEIGADDYPRIAVEIPDDFFGDPFTVRANSDLADDFKDAVAEARHRVRACVEDEIESHYAQIEDLKELLS